MAPAEVVAAEEAAADRVELHTITKAVRDHFSPEERVKMIEMLWDVVYVDGDDAALLARTCHIWVVTL